jgi:hypothetical protein
MATQGVPQGTGKHGHRDSKEPYPHHDAQKGGEQGGARSAESGRRGGEHRGSEGGSEHRGGEHRGSQASGEHRGGEHRGAQGGGEGGPEDLKAREYRDVEGNVHHHTRTYMEQHKDEK